MFIQNFKVFSKIVQLNDILNAVPYHWNTALLKLDCVECPKRRTQRYICLLLHFVALLIYCLQGVVTFGTNPEYLKLSPAELFFYWLALLLNVGSHISLHVCNIKADSICAYINGLISFQSRHDNLHGRNVRKNTSDDRFTILLVYNLVAATCIIPLAFPTVLHWFNCCRPSLLGYWLISECNPSLSQNAVVSILSKVAVFAFNVWIWAFCFVNKGILVGAILYTMCVVTMRKSIEL